LSVELGEGGLDARAVERAARAHAGAAFDQRGIKSGDNAAGAARSGEHLRRRLGDVLTEVGDPSAELANDLAIFERLARDLFEREIPNVELFRIGQRQRGLRAGDVVDWHLVDIGVLDIGGDVHVMGQVAVFLVEERLRRCAPAHQREQAQSQRCRGLEPTIHALFVLAIGRRPGDGSDSIARVAITSAQRRGAVGTTVIVGLTGKL
jgi:hypothetical protein